MKQHLRLGQAYNSPHNVLAHHNQSGISGNHIQKNVLNKKGVQYLLMSAEAKVFG
ncbi:hypothetical protein JR666_001625 [Salmonella enterica]|nr:hypothetical protein [Salmonella enterica]